MKAKHRVVNNCSQRNISEDFDKFVPNRRIPIFFVNLIIKSISSSKRRSLVISPQKSD